MRKVDFIAGGGGMVKKGGFGKNRGSIVSKEI
jgi:hypothetical protein